MGIHAHAGPCGSGDPLSVLVVEDERLLQWAISETLSSRASTVALGATERQRFAPSARNGTMSCCSICVSRIRGT